MNEMQNRTKISFCVKQPLPFCFWIKGAPREGLGGGGLSWPCACTAATRYTLHRDIASLMKV